MGEASDREDGGERVANVDIARRAGVSKSTVSAAHSGGAQVVERCATPGRDIAAVSRVGFDDIAEAGRSAPPFAGPTRPAAPERCGAVRHFRRAS